MSGGSFNYMYGQIRDTYEGQLEDDELNKMIIDLCKLLHALEWYRSCDTTEEDYIIAKKEFKNKWFGNRDEKLIETVIKRLDNTIKDIKNM